MFSAKRRISGNCFCPNKCLFFCITKRRNEKKSQIVLPMPKRLKVATICTDFSIYIINTIIPAFSLFYIHAKADLVFHFYFYFVCVCVCILNFVHQNRNSDKILFTSWMVCHVYIMNIVINITTYCFVKVFKATE